MLPIDETALLFVPAMAACALVGWWAGGRATSAIIWIILAFYVAGPRLPAGNVFANLARGWTLLLAGTFGVMCLVGSRRPFFTKALLSVIGALGIAIVIGLVGPVTLTATTSSVAGEFAQRNEEFLKFLNGMIADAGPQWTDLASRFPTLATLPTDAAEHLAVLSNAGQVVFPALLVLESLAALALAWAAYHRLSRRRLGSPLAPLREFRFNDQLVWGLIVGLVIMLLPNLGALRGFGLNLIVFFGALYAMRGLGVLAWFLKPGALPVALLVGFVMLFAPFLNVLAVLGFLTLGITALGLGVGDTWADWRRRARSTLS